MVTAEGLLSLPRAGEAEGDVGPLQPGSRTDGRPPGMLRACFSSNLGWFSISKGKSVGLGLPDDVVQGSRG
jgi:hypothetical protein